MFLELQNGGSGITVGLKFREIKSFEIDLLDMANFQVVDKKWGYKKG